MSKHSPLPWESSFKSFGKEKWQIWGANNNVVCHLPSAISDEHAANNALILAAPELLATCKQVFEALNAYLECDEMVFTRANCHCARLRQAIDLAEPKKATA